MTLLVNKIKGDKPEYYNNKWEEYAIWENYLYVGGQYCNRR
jgi:hypothetical protein